MVFFRGLLRRVRKIMTLWRRVLVIMIPSAALCILGNKIGCSLLGIDMTRKLF